MRVGTSLRGLAPMVRNRAAAAATMHIHKDALVKERSSPPTCSGTIGLTSNCSIGLAATRTSFMPPPVCLFRWAVLALIHLARGAHNAAHAGRDTKEKHHN